MVIYYKCIVKDLSEANENLKAQVEYATGEALEYRTCKLELERENEKLTKKLTDWQKKYDKEVEDSKKRMQSLLLK
jgi:FtsZ-binding cell division protein ZapB